MLPYNMNGLIKKYIGFGIFSQILQILLLILIVAIGSHFMISYFKENLPLPNIREIEERVRLRKRV
jgi:hypothetical protein